MGKQYISTAIVGNAHVSDIMDVKVSKSFTVTCSSDGFLKIWNHNASNTGSSNLTDESSLSPQTKVLVDKLGLHHLTLFEDIIEETRVLFICVVSFSGKAYIYRYDYSSNTLISCALPDELTNTKNSYWACQFHKDPEGAGHKLAITMVTGITHVFSVEFDNKDSIKIAYINKTSSVDSSFALCLDIDSTNHKLIVGHQNGTAYLFDLDSLNLIYTFSNFGLKQSSSANLSSVRSTKFSPGGTILAIARDSGSYGVVTLYDVKFGESIGNLTALTHSANVGIGGYTHEGWCMALSFNEEGDLLATGGIDDKIRIWNTETKEREATITISKADVADSDLDTENGNKEDDEMDNPVCSSLQFIKKGVLSEAGQNDALVVVGFDRAVRWFREAGGI